ncbi:MAG: hypothetical protein QF890_09420 [Myxococcota bacterium]|jgi:hypothetical protein|nr:hypothetical protein [bacterium]MDP7298425.1 hypothetical protein [Myxococcota bacterium]MDP7432775.1 hypothetical protein [Myxococcota bacterium]HJO22049.1 hypothetical protein [Myxococcota bacterium]
MTVWADGTSSVPQGEDGKLITCFLPKEKALAVAERVHQRKNMISCDFTGGRGSGLVKSVCYGHSVEVDILSIIVRAEEADGLFEFIYHEAGIGRSQGGFIFQSALSRSTPFALPELPEEP